VVHDPDADCPIWRQFLLDIMDGNKRLVEYLRRLVGLSLTGSTQEHILAFMYGVGANGKSTFLNAVQDLLGSDYAMKSDPDLLMVKRGNAHPTERADLFRKRFVVCIEAAEGRRIAEGLVKEMTGGDRIRARRMREDFWEFEPTHKLWLAANHKPTIRGTDYGIWRRVKLIPFTVTIPPERQDKQLPEKLAAERSGILNWALLGCTDWQAHGLDDPPEVTAATDEYRQEQDVFGAFLDERCLTSSELETPASDLYRAYKQWCEENGEHPSTQTKFGLALTERGFGTKRTRNGVIRRGIGLKDKEIGPNCSRADNVLFDKNLRSSCEMACE
jgi:putative DNA primase/helicase